MTLHTIIGFAATFVFAYGLTLCVFGGTFILTDLFTDWYQEFKQSRNDSDKQKNKDDGKS